MPDDGSSYGNRSPRDSDELTGPQREALEALYANREPRPGLDQDIFGGLVSDGLIPTRPLGTLGGRPRLRTIVASAALFVLGFAASEFRPAAGVIGSTDDQFMLLLYDPPELASRSDEQHAATVEAYRNWGLNEVAAGRLVSGQPLMQDRELLQPSDGSVSTPDQLSPDVPNGYLMGGYFIISATDFEEAVRVAETHPHRANGGWIEVRPIQDGGMQVNGS